MGQPFLRLASVGFAALACAIAGCGGGSSSPSSPNPGATATPTPGATATPTPGATATPGPGFAFGGASAPNQAFTSGQSKTVSFSAYAGIAADITFGPPTSSFSLSFADAVNNGDITPAGFVADNATAGNTPIVYFSITNGSAVDGSFGTMTPAFAITDTNAGFASYATCELDVYGQQGGGSQTWFAPGASGTRSGTTVNVPSINLGAGGSVDFKPNSQTVVAISCH